MISASLNIKSHKVGRGYSRPHFYILCKGHNSGKPLEQPCPNCFVCICRDYEEKQYLYWLFYGLWQGKFFEPFLTGSVIPFIRLEDLKEVTQNALSKTGLKPQLYARNIAALQTLEKQNKLILGQIKLIREAKRILMLQVLK
jgi:hypothetical protein